MNLDDLAYARQLVKDRSWTYTLSWLDHWADRAATPAFGGTYSFDVKRLSAKVAQSWGSDPSVVPDVLAEAVGVYRWDEFPWDTWTGQWPVAGRWPTQTRWVIIAEEYRKWRPKK